MVPYYVHDSRERALQGIAEGIYHEGIQISITTAPLGDFREGELDPDGDLISAYGEPQFLCPDDEDFIFIRFRRGVSHETIGRKLRKCAEMFDGPHGCELANLTQEPGNSFSAHRLPNGELFFCKNADDYGQYLKTVIALGQTEVDVPAAIE